MENTIQPKWKLLNKYPHVRQLDETDCGAACLAMISKHYGVRLSLGKLRDQASVGQEGASLNSVSVAAEKLGYITRMLKANFSQMKSLDFPLIAHWEGTHFVVVYQINRRHVIVADPAVGLIKMSHEEFMSGWTGYLLTLTPTPALLGHKPPKTTFFRFLPYVWPYRKLLLEIFLASILLELFALVSPIFTQVVVDRVLVHQNVNMLNLMLIGMLIISLFQAGTTILRDYFAVHLSEKLDLRFSSDLLRQMLRLPMQFFQTRRIGDVMQRFEDNEEIQDVLTGKAISTVLDVMTVVLTLALMFYYSVQLSMIALIAMPLYVIVTLAFTPAIKRLNLQSVEQSAATNSQLIEIFKTVRTVKSQTAENQMRWKQEDHLVREANLSFKEASLDMLLSGLSSAIDIFARLILFWYGAHMVIRGDLSLGQLVAFQALVAMALNPIMSLIGLWDEMQEAHLSLQRLADVHDFDAEQPVQNSVVHLPSLEGAIEFQNVSFRYNPDDSNILDEVTFRIDPGMTVAVAGRSGAGKTTLIDMIQRFHRPNQGKILLDGYDLATADLRSLRTQIGIVPQTPDIFSATIRDNIAVGQPDASLEKIMQAAELANASEFINAFPLGYDTIIGEGGIRLSGGQIQRIAIARALLHDPPILIFDEATSALDTDSERAIQRNLHETFQTRTSIIIAHRLSTIRNADKIIVMDSGQIAEIGTHSELMNKEGLYCHLVSQQSTI